MEWVEQEEKGVIGIIGSLNINAEQHVWDRQVAQSRGVLVVLRLLKRLAADAKATVERDSVKQ